MRKKILILIMGGFLSLASCDEEKSSIDRAYDLLKSGTTSKAVIAQELTSDTLDIAALSDEELVKAMDCIDFIGIDRSEKDEELFSKITKRYLEADNMHHSKMEEIKKKLEK